jgi:hypothetical protein
MFLKLDENPRGTLQTKLLNIPLKHFVDSSKVKVSPQPGMNQQSASVEYSAIWFEVFP